jgi:transcriptional regulator with XRE-family HTH domain
VKKMAFGDRVKSLRKEKGWTQQYCADQIGVPRATWAGYEAEDKIPKDKNTLSKIADLLGTSVDYLLGKTDIKEPIKNQNDTGVVDLQKILEERTERKVLFDGEPIPDEVAEFLYYQLKAFKEKLLQKKKQD